MLFHHPLTIGAGVFLTSFFLFACEDDAPAPGPEASPASVVATSFAGVPSPADNPPNPDKVELGRLLYWDPILSGNRDLACASCHDPAFGYSDGRPTSIGTGGQKAARGALTVLDAAWNGWTALEPSPDATQAPMFWDNRARSLESQARGPITAAGEMRGATIDEACAPEHDRRAQVASTSAHVREDPAAHRREDSLEGRSSAERDQHHEEERAREDDRRNEDLERPRVSRDERGV